MTTQITKIAMFAIAAFALVGIAGAPAFAASYASISVTAGSGYSISGTDTVSCGSEQCMAQVASHTTDDYIKYYFGTIGGNQCDVTSLVVGAGPQHSHNHGTVSGIVYHQYDADVDQNDRITVTNTYTNCT